MHRFFATLWMSFAFALYVGSTSLAIDVARAALKRKNNRFLLEVWYNEPNELQRGLYMFELIDRARVLRLDRR